jgi:hypothetical protein
VDFIIANEMSSPSDLHIRVNDLSSFFT